MVCAHITCLLVDNQNLYLLFFHHAHTPCWQLTKYMARNSGIVGGLLRFSNKTRHLVVTKERYPWHYCAKRKSYCRSTAEKQALAPRCKEHKLSYKEALQQATKAVRDEAEWLKEQSGGHSVDYYIVEIMQTSHIQKKGRSINRWNAYLRNEVKHINSGMCP
jgi:hypothetical protein